MGLGMCIQNRGLRGPGLEGPTQDTALDWIPYPHGTEHWIRKISQLPMNINANNRSSKWMLMFF